MVRSTNTESSSATARICLFVIPKMRFALLNRVPLVSTFDRGNTHSKQGVIASGGMRCTFRVHNWQSTWTVSTLACCLLQRWKVPNVERNACLLAGSLDNPTGWSGSIYLVAGTVLLNVHAHSITSVEAVENPAADPRHALCKSFYDSVMSPVQSHARPHSCSWHPPSEEQPQDLGWVRFTLGDPLFRCCKKTYTTVCSEQ